MYNGMYGGYGGGGMGGQEMMIISVCCLCCICLAVIGLGYFTNMFCGMGEKFGKSCPAKSPSDSLSNTDPLPSDVPAAPSSVVESCSQAWGRQSRAKNDPRPPIRPEYCRSAGRQLGRDCYYWEVQDDPVTGMARWMRKADEEDGKNDLRYGGECTPVVQCPTFIDPKTLDRYSEVEAQQLLKQCQAVATTASNETETIRELTRAARTVSRKWIDVAWGDVHSRIWYNTVLRFVGQRNLKPHIDNASKAAKNLMNKFNTDIMRKSTFAYILEAAIRAPDNRSDWIIDSVNAFIKKAGATQRDAAFVAYLRGINRTYAQWETIIDNPRRY